MEDVKIEFLADTRNPTTLAESYDTMPIHIDDVSSLPECDLALLAIPVGVKEDYVKEFSKRGCYIFTEKPFALNLETHQSFLNLTDKITCNNENKVTFSDSIQQTLSCMNVSFYHYTTNPFGHQTTQPDLSQNPLELNPYNIITNLSSCINAFFYNNFSYFFSIKIICIFRIFKRDVLNNFISINPFQLIISFRAYGNNLKFYSITC